MVYVAADGTVGGKKSLTTWFRDLITGAPDERVRGGSWKQFRYFFLLQHVSSVGIRMTSSHALFALLFLSEGIFSLIGLFFTTITNPSAIEGHRSHSSVRQSFCAFLIFVPQS